MIFQLIYPWQLDIDFCDYALNIDVVDAISVDNRGKSDPFTATTTTIYRQSKLYW